MDKPLAKLSAEESFISFQSKQPLNQGSVNRNANSFPYFPDDDDNTIYGIYMKKVLKIVESWMYTQCFFKKKYYVIPEDISEVSPDDNYGITTPYFRLFTNVAGSKLRRYIKKW